MSAEQFLNDLEKKLWSAADKLRSTLDAAQYKHAVLGLLFVKYVSDAFDIRRKELIEQFKNPEHDYFLDPEDYGVDERELRRYRQFFTVYPQIREALPPGLLKIASPIRDTVTPESSCPGKMLLQKLSFSHFAELLQLADPLKRKFYEVES